MALTLDGLAGYFEYCGLDLDKTIPSDTIIDLSSSGVQKVGGEPPALYLDANDAMLSWQRAAVRFADGMPPETRFKWIEKPTLDRWQITMTDKHVTHRMASHRYNVFARIAVK